MTNESTEISSDTECRITEEGETINESDDVPEAPFVTIQQATTESVASENEGPDCDLYFNDDERKIDFILVWKNNKNEDLKTKSDRDSFLFSLEDEGIDLEEEISSNGELIFLKLHATNDFLFRYAEKYEIKMPFCKTWQDKIKEHEQEVLMNLAADERARQRFLKLSLKRNLRLNSERGRLGSGRNSELVVTDLKTKSNSTINLDRSGSNFGPAAYDIISDIDWSAPENNFLSDVGEYTATGIRIYRGIIEKTASDILRKYILDYIQIKDTSYPSEKEWLYSAEYRRSEHAFFVDAELDEEEKIKIQDNLFSSELESNRSLERIRLIGICLLEKLELDDYIEHKVFLRGYPLHEGETDQSHNQSMRTFLHRNFSRFSNIFTVVPIDIIRSYFGEEVGFYFAFLCLYTVCLGLFSIVGIIAFIYGLLTVDINTRGGYLNETCSLNFTLCPICNEGCPFFNAADLCFSAQILHMFDNNFSLAYSCMISLWAIIFLELWKRKEFELAYKWNCSECGESYSDVRLRPKYKAAARKFGGPPKYYPGLLKSQPYIGIKNVVIGWAKSLSWVLFFLLIVIASVVSCLIYNLWLNAIWLPKNHELNHFGEDSIVTAYWSYEYIISAFVTALLCGFLIIWDFIFNFFAHKFTEWEYPRTQVGYDNSYSFKIFTFYLVNYFSWPLYIAFIKDALKGTPPKYTTIRMGGYDYKWQGCGPAGCNYEVTLQLIIVLTIKPIFKNILHMIFPPLRVWLNKLGMKKVETENEKQEKLRKWEKEYTLMPENPIIYDYCELIVQFGFVTLFSSAFPLAGIFAFLNNLVELRRDGRKYTKYTQRPVPRRVRGIGIWQPAFKFMAHFSILTNILQMAFISDTIPKWLYKKDNGGTLQGYAETKFNKISVQLLSQNGLRLEHIPNSDSTVPEYCYHDVDGTYNNETAEFEYSKNYYRIWVYKLGYALIFMLLIYVFVWIIEHLIPDQPQHLVDRQQQTKTIIAHKREIIRHHNEQKLRQANAGINLLARNRPQKRRLSRQTSESSTIRRASFQTFNHLTRSTSGRNFDFGRLTLGHEVNNLTLPGDRESEV